MKKKSKDSKNFKNPSTVFGELLKNAIAKPIAENKTEDKPQNPNIITKTSPKPTQPPANNNLPKQNLTYKMGDIKPAPVSKPAPVKENTFAEKQSQNQIPIRPKQTSPVSSPKPPITPILPVIQKPPIEEAKNTKPVSAKTNVEANQTKSSPDNSQKYSKLMREKFWEKINGEALSGIRGRTLRINLGIDLGTSFSKVVYRLGGESFPVCFGMSKNKIDDYMIPSVVVIGGKAIKCQFEVEDQTKLSKAVLIPNFKICLTCERGDGEAGCSITKCNLSNLRTGYLPSEIINEEASFLTAFYLAKLIAHTKEAVRHQLSEREIPSDVTVKWSANLAVPDKYFDSKVAEGFRETLEIAWLMSEMFLAHPTFSNKTESTVCYLAAKDLHKEIKDELLQQNQDFDCFTYSEIGAEVASVTLSPTSEEGLYVLVDVGAGTVDTSVFRFRRIDGESKQETYAANIFKLGAAQIDARANSSFRRKSLNWLRQIKENVFRLNPNEALLHITEEIKSAESDVTIELREKLLTVYREAFAKQKNVETWSKLKLMMGGGGSSIQSYCDTAREAFTPKLKDSRPIEIFRLKVPRDFQMGTIPMELFHRFAVAYGLSRDLIELPELLSSNKIAPMNVLRQKIYIDPTNDG